MTTPASPTPPPSAGGSDSPLALTTNVATLPGVGDARAAALNRLGIRAVADLILHLPLRYERDLGEQTIGAASDLVGDRHGADANVAVAGEIASARTAGYGRRTRFEATLEDGTGTIKLTWFNAPWMRGKLHPGDHIRVAGKAKRHGDYLQIVNPQWTAVAPEDIDPDASGGDGLRPVYPASEQLSSPVLRKLIDSVLDDALALIDDHLPADIRESAAMPELADAYRRVHRPEDEADAAAGRRRLAFDELFMLQVGVMLKRRQRTETLKAPPLKFSDAIDDHIRARLPFTLTDAQSDVAAEIATDLQRSYPMNRLVQGDVGSGKTAVALYAMLLAVASEQQAALMAPTELLAEQHFQSISAMLAGARVRIALLTGSLPAAERRKVEDDIRDGLIDIVIGTHAMLTESVRFQGLAIAVIDEQHRFGVHQRAGLRWKPDDPDAAPHALIMTATPIPRTLSLTLFGDLDVSTIRSLPPGRQPVATRAMPAARRDEVYAFVRERLQQGEQAYIVAPVIDESEEGLRGVVSLISELTAGPLHGLRLAPLHGRLSRDQRDATMTAFRQGAIDGLIATTVIEVGVDVPNASIIVIEQADRFGLAQLHQLRGRVGRGERKSVCILVADPVTEDGAARITAMIDTGDGFEIAERDLEIRGPGELFGLRQAGAAPFQAAEIPRDMPLLQLARREAEDLIATDPDLGDAAHALLRRRLLKKHGAMLGVADVG